MSRFSRTTVQAVLTGLSLLAAGSVLAQIKQDFDTLDQNHDGKISLAEASNNDTLFVAFKGLDTNKDGELSRDEFAKHK